MNASETSAPLFVPTKMATLRKPVSLATSKSVIASMLLAPKVLVQVMLSLPAPLLMVSLPPRPSSPLLPALSMIVRAAGCQSG